MTYSIIYKVFTTKEFDNNFSKLDESDKNKISKIMNKLKKRGNDVGKPLT